MPQKRWSIYSFVGKRVLDVVFSVVVLIVTLPIACAVAFAIRWTSPGPIIFRQQRLGRNGRPFTIYKFRTMQASVDPYALTPRSEDHDIRVTRLGRVLRNSGIDELPQFWNVLKGDMSVVGPRPEMPFLMDHYSPRQRRRLRVDQGITGLWQISEARREPIRDNLQYDVYYVRHQSVWLDLAVVARTCWIMLRPRRAKLPEAPPWARRVKRRERQPVEAN